MSADRRCGYVRCRQPLKPGASPTARYCDGVCQSRQRTFRDRGGAVTEAPQPEKLASATQAMRGHAARRPTPPRRWIGGDQPALIAEAKREFEALLAREEAQMTRGRPKGRAGVGT